MPIDDLDQLLAMELGAAPEQKKVSEQVSSLEAHVLGRMRQNQPDPETVETPSPESVPSVIPLATSTLPPLPPISQYADALLPVIIQVLKYFQSRSNVSHSDLALLRTQVAESLFSLPDIKDVDKAGIFAAMATCINAVNTSDSEARRVAQDRLKRLSDSIIKAQQSATGERNIQIEQFLNNIAD